MRKNIGTTDKGIRILIPTGIAIVYYLNYISGTVGIILMVASVIFLITSLVNFCPIYKILGINSCKIKNKNSK